MLRAWERAEDEAAARVPDDNDNAPGDSEKRVCGGCLREKYTGHRMDSQDVFLPRLGPDNWMMDGG